MKNELTDKKLWKRIQEIRANFRDPERLKMLVTQWEEDFDDETRDHAKKLMGERAHQYWASLAKKGDTFDRFLKLSWESWTDGKFTIERKEQEAQIHCTGCPMADAYRAIGRSDLGHYFHCDEDVHMVHGFNRDIEFRRTKTLMDDDCCDHFYAVKR